MQRLCTYIFDARQICGRLQATARQTLLTRRASCCRPCCRPAAPPLPPRCGPDARCAPCMASWALRRDASGLAGRLGSPGRLLAPQGGRARPHKLQPSSYYESLAAKFERIECHLKSGERPVSRIQWCSQNLFLRAAISNPSACKPSPCTHQLRERHSHKPSQAASPRQLCSAEGSLRAQEMAQISRAGCRACTCSRVCGGAALPPLPPPPPPAPPPARAAAAAARRRRRVATRASQRRQRDPASYRSMDDLRAELEGEGRREGLVSGLINWLSTAANAASATASPLQARGHPLVHGPAARGLQGCSPPFMGDPAAWGLAS